MYFVESPNEKKKYKGGENIYMFWFIVKMVMVVSGDSL